MPFIRFNRRKWPLAAMASALISFGAPPDPVIGDDQTIYSSSPGRWVMKPFYNRRNDGCQGFGLNFHPGYGYGGRAGGVGPGGGYPFYGGTGYPGPMPQLRRWPGLVPVLYYGNPGGPTPMCPHFYGIPGPLVENPHVINVEKDPYQPEYHGGYGVFSGAYDYPESTFVPSHPVSPVPSPSPSNAGPTPLESESKEGK